ncbi:uncharacterized protein LOC120005552 isoform X3 [Tripterygium wilfordii]|uniref:uncharacterized protein LOC120005552 isoform X3 n=1 Tax=Tripterygium wilfordii TaxID=458696 RepID=UPI0018F8177D|nr:uncharacterized protein LOC120005552 isoform X3 [Tripterygium wilfordii]
MSLSVYNVISMAVIFFLFRLSFLAGSSQGFFRRSDPLFLAFLLLFFGSSLESRSFHSRSERELLLSQHRISVTRASQEMVFGFSPGISMEAFLSLFIRSGKVIVVHVLDEKAGAYHNLESLWKTETSPKDSIQCTGAYTVLEPPTGDFETFFGAITCK